LVEKVSGTLELVVFFSAELQKDMALFKNISIFASTNSPSMKEGELLYFY
jgi:hypothetical protein